MKKIELNLNFGGDELSRANRLAEIANVKLTRNGITVDAVKCDEPTVRVKCNNGKAVIYYNEPCHFNRAFGLLAEALADGKKRFDISEKPSFRMNGIMFDMCHGYGAFTVEYFKEVIDRIALMGLNTILVYIEENYEVNNQPYFGYMRPSYTKEMLKEIDDYAYSMGIEAIPCIQTLAHLRALLRWGVYGDYLDYDDCLLVGDPRTYKLVDDIISTLSECFRTRRIHVGMDEAESLGHEKYLVRNGYRKQTDIMREHMDKVIEICEKYGIEPMMWDDMFFKSMRESGVEINPETIAAACPKGIIPVFWHYDEAPDTFFKQHISLSPETVFAGGCWAWFSWGLEYNWTYHTTVDCLTKCKKYGVKDVFITTWGDHGAEIPQPVNLVGAQMYAEIGYSDELDEKKLAKRFKFCTGGDLADFKALDMFDSTPVTGDFSSAHINTSKMFMWQDILTGLFDKDIEGYDLRKHYGDLARKLEGSEKRNGMFNDMFVLMKKAADFLEIKGDIGVRLTEAYRTGDMKKLTELYADVEEMQKRFNGLVRYYSKYWNTIYMPLGWGKFDLRFGGLGARINTAKNAIKDYLNGKTDSIPELEVERKYYKGSKGLPGWCNAFWKIIAPEME
ncbi:MAG: beta-N-acetylhexosaminidase [Firmicutes bacterium]|nr:beta-N-acetylhexosaminidase [Candidatus Colimorpha enterica]